MPRGVPNKKPVPAPVEEPVAEPVAEVEEESFVEEDAVEEQALAEAVAAEEPVQVDETTPEPHAVGGVELPFDEDEEIVSQRTADDAVLFVVTNYGRKIRIEPNGTYEVVTGPAFGTASLIPEPGRESWKEPREPLED